MLLSLLHYLSNPLYFGVFTIVVGVSYIGIWILSLRGLIKKRRVYYTRPVNGRQEEKKEKIIRQAYFGGARNTGTPRAAARRANTTNRRQTRLTRPAKWAA